MLLIHKIRIIRSVFWISCFAFTCQVNAQSSVLSTGKWYKVAVDKNGVYKIDLGKFKDMGFDSKSDPRKIKVYGNRGGMLPQPNSEPRPDDLTELAIFIKGEDDGVFNSGDYILFYGEGSDRYYLDQNSGTFSYENNIYDDTNYYYITVSSANGKRVASRNSIAGTYPVITSYNDFLYHELDQYSELKSGREWFGERFDLQPSQTFDCDASGIVPGSTLRLVSNVMARSFLGSSFSVSLNGVTLGELYVSLVPNTPYAVRGIQTADTFDISAEAANAVLKNTQSVRFSYSNASSGTSQGYLNYFLLQYERSLILKNNQTLFRSLKSIQNPISTFEISGAAAQSTVWDISNPYEPVEQSGTLNSGKFTFAASTETLHEFVVFNPDVAVPKLIGKVANQNLHGLTTPDVIIISPVEFLSEAQRLAAHRETHSHVDVAVVQLDQLFNEFSSGKKDITAIRDFAKYMYDKSPGKLKSLLLFGKTSYDYRNLTIDNRNFIPTYESRNSLHPLESYSSDDFYGFLEDNEGNWGESPAENHTLDIGVGRLPVKSIDEAANVVDKIIRYETDFKNTGTWEKQITFVADDGNITDGFTSEHQSQANTMAETIEATYPEFDTRKIFLGVYNKEVSLAGERIPQANVDIEKAFNDGSIIINYTGHGAEKLWADERIFDEISINELENKKLPFLVTATCDFGRHDDPTFISSGENVVLKKDHGAIGLVTTTRLVNAFTNFTLNKAFYNGLFHLENNQYRTLGEIFMDTKNNSVSGASNRNFSLLADPSMKLNLPERKVVVESITTSEGSTTLSALSKVTVTGVVQYFDGITDTEYNGVLTATLFDKRTEHTTIGKNNPAFNFSAFDNALFRGCATISNGTFEFEFIVSKNIAYQIGTGKLSMFAFDDVRNIFAAGSSEDLQIGSSAGNSAGDVTGPTVKLYVGDTTFINGGITNPDTWLVARLTDENGINISGYGIGNSIAATLDENTTFILNDYYYADADDYSKGMIRYPMNGLLPGRHSLTLKAWDTYNNPSQATIEFVVTEGNQIVISEFRNYPNPFVSATNLYFIHNRSGDDLQATIQVIDRNGAEILAKELYIENSSYRVELLQLDREEAPLKNLQQGLYFARLVVRSLSNNSKNETVTKLILLN